MTGASSSSTSNTTRQHLAQSTRAGASSGSTEQRERRTSQASNNSGDSRRNSGQFGRQFYPSPAPSSPASSPTHALAQFFPSSSTLPAGLSSLASPPLSSSSSNSTSPGLGSNNFASSGYYANPALAGSVGPGASSPMNLSHSQQQNYAQYYAQTQSSMPSPGLAMLQGIEAQLQMSQSQFQQNRNSMSASMTGTAVSSHSGNHSRRQSSAIPVPVSGEQQYSTDPSSRVSGPTHRIPAAHQTTHRPASTTILPVQPSILHSPPMQQYPSSSSSARQTPSGNHHQHQQQNFLYSSATHTAPQLSQSTRAPFPAPLVVLPPNSASTGPSASTNAAAAAGQHRNRASHQIVPLSAHTNAPQQIPTIALHTAQYSNPNRQKVFFGDYQLLHTLGEGEFGKVKLGVHAQRWVYQSWRAFFHLVEACFPFFTLKRTGSAKERRTDNEKDHADFPFSCVCIARRWGEEVAIKLIKKGNINDAARSLKVQREIDVLRVGGSFA